MTVPGMDPARITQNPDGSLLYRGTTPVGVDTAGWSSPIVIAGLLVMVHGPVVLGNDDEGHHHCGGNQCGDPDIQPQPIPPDINPGPRPDPGPQPVFPDINPGPRPDPGPQPVFPDINPGPRPDPGPQPVFPDINPGPRPDPGPQPAPPPPPPMPPAPAPPIPAGASAAGCNGAPGVDTDGRYLNPPGADVFPFDPLRDGCGCVAPNPDEFGVVPPPEEWCREEELMP